MQYQGGKERIAQALSTEMMKRQTDQVTYLEPFLGGGSVLARMAPHFPECIASDVMPELVTLWDAAANHGWTPPESLDRATYDALKAANNPDDPLTAFAAFGLSFGGKRWGGYASNRRGDDFCGAARRSVMRRAAGMAGTTFHVGSYEQHTPDAGTVVYADPPYAGTTGYSGSGDWDPDKFWRTMREWSEAGALVFVSEYAAPTGWESVWARQKRMTLEKGDNLRAATEHLFTWGR